MAEGERSATTRLGNISNRSVSRLVAEGGAAFVAQTMPVSLRRMRMLAQLNAADEALLRSLKPKTFVAGSQLTSGAKDEAFLILAGWCARRVGHGSQQRVGLLLLPGDPIGLDSPRWAGDDLPVTALTEVIAVRASALLAAVESRPQEHAQLAAACRRALLREQAFCLASLLRLGCNAAVERVAHLFLELHLRLDEVGLATGARFRLPVSQNIVAQMLGLSLVHLHRTVRQLRRDKLIRTEDGFLELLDISKLTEVSGFAPPAGAADATRRAPEHDQQRT